MKSLEWVLILYDYCPYKKKEEEYQVKRGIFKGKKIMTDIGVMLPQAKECLRLQITGTAKKGPPLEFERHHGLTCTL